MKQIVCFGDSNTYGYIPENGERYAIIVREEFSCLEFYMNRDTINWILKNRIQEVGNGEITEIYPCKWH